ncbi:MAG: adenylate/guanylate cyclase domain-containing protein [Mycobacteriaceae bacterium]|nr:adenylate/guanylate cyclase domain-containing protein [Mycobacteriaceae bacterium]MBV9639203.1 adenylate/guanylate cyclase domain-containing protein [Mycobacteriaceae bacterium]
MAADVDIETSGLLEGLDGDARAQRAELIAWLLERGFTVEQIRGAFAPMLLPARRVMGDSGSYVSAREIAESNEIQLELLQRLQRAVGLPRVDDPEAAVHMRADGEAAARAKEFIDAGLDPEHVVSVVRVLADGLARAAETMRRTALAAVSHPGATELEIAKASEAMVSHVAPLLGPMIQDMLFLQLRHSMETEAVNASERDAGALPGARDVTIAFADMVGFTRLGEAVPPEDLERLARGLSDLTREVVGPPVRLIKTIGDAVMLMSPEPVPLLDALLDLVAAAEKEDLPQLRVGVASGSAVSRAGDWFGSPVNVASRVTGVARPGSVLAAEPTRELIGDAEQFSWSFAGARHLKGVKGETRVFRVRRATDES